MLKRLPHIFSLLPEGSDNPGPLEAPLEARRPAWPSFNFSFFKTIFLEVGIESVALNPNRK